ncbi:MAG: B12-binding domain-containing radical SAM protein [Magnetococcales bacterium]|nr:B12-binding domain-containing radical SAM protein [Magnetococcales bacterium]
MNLLLITLRTVPGQDETKEAALMPIGLGYIAAAVKKYSNHKVFIIDLPHRVPQRQDDLDHMASFIREQEIHILGVSAMVPNFRHCQALTHALKKLFPSLYIIVGGPLPTTLPEVILKHCAVDTVVTGPGEIAMLNILESLERGEQPPPVVHGTLPDDLDQLPFPDWQLMGYDTYEYLPPWSEFMVFSSRGCPYNCHFCYKVTGRAYKYRSIDNFFEEVRHVVEVLGVTNIQIRDDLFFLNPKRILGFCDKVMASNLRFKWTAMCRVDLINELLILRMKEAGCYAVQLGLESGSQEMLKRMNKRLSLQKSAANIALLRQHGIKIMTYIIVGYPGENEETLQETMDFLSANQLYSGMSFAFPFPGTELWRSGQESGIVPDVEDYLHRDSFITQKLQYNFTAMSTARFAEIIDRMKETVLLQVLERVMVQVDLNRYSHLVIYGCGVVGKAFFQLLQNQHPIIAARVRLFLDDDPLRVNREHQGVPVVPLAKAVLEEETICFLANFYSDDLMMEKMCRFHPHIPCFGPNVALVDPRNKAEMVVPLTE